MCVAELACAIPSNAGAIMWVNVAFRPWFTLSTVMWTMALNVVDNSLYPTVFADYCATVFLLSPLQKALTKIAFLWACAFINVVGVHFVGAFSVVIMVVTAIPFFGMLLCQLPEGFDWVRISYVPPAINWSLFLPVISWNFSGFDSAGHVIEEVSNPSKTFVRALLLMIVVALLTYVPPVLVGASASSLRSTPWSAWTDGFWVKVGAAVGGRPLAALVMIGGTISTLGLMTTLLATTSRSLAGMGTLNAFPESFSRWVSRYDQRYATPVNSILVNTALTSVLSVMLTFDVLVAIDQVLYALRIIVILACFLVLRFRHPQLKRPYSAPGGSTAAILWAGVPMVYSVFLLVVSMLGGQGLFWSSIVIVLGSAVASFFAVATFRKGGFEGEIVVESVSQEQAAAGLDLDAADGNAEQSEMWHPSLKVH